MPGSSGTSQGALDAESRAWVRSLRAEGDERVLALERLHDLCCGPHAGRAGSDGISSRWAGWSSTTSASRLPTTQLNKRQVDENQVFNLAVTRADLLTGVDPATGNPAPYGSVGVDINCAVIGFTDKAPSANLADPVPNSQFPPK